MAVMNKKGFTIVELLVSVLLTSIIMGAIYSVYRVQTHSAKVQENRLEAQEYARSVLDMMVREIRNAAYNPLSATLGTNCAGGLAGAPGVITATATSVRFTYDFQGTTAGSAPNGHCNDSDEDIAYTYDTTGCAAGLGNVTRNGSGNPLTICNVTSFDLRYFKQDGSELSRPVIAADLPNIQRVLITLTVQSLKPDTEFGGQLTATMTSNADLRNRGLPS
jgi:prepilin-type N-terminal cleavage/methylation domain-containing protein